MSSEPNVDVVRQEGQSVKIATWNFAGLCCERKQKEISEVHIVAGQETWERKDKVVNVDWLSLVLIIEGLARSALLSLLEMLGMRRVF